MPEEKRKSSGLSAAEAGSSGKLYAIERIPLLGGVWVSKRLLSVILATTLAGLGGSYWHSATAQTCSGSACGRPVLQFVPGQSITVEIINRSPALLEIQKIYGSDAVPLASGEVIRFVQYGGTDSNVSVVFWEPTSSPIRARVSKPNPKTLKIELELAPSEPGDRSVYVRDDGRVVIF